MSTVLTETPLETGQAPAEPVPPSARLVLFLALAGAVDAAWLTYRHLFESGACTGGGCDAVLSSRYASMLGVPLAALGLGLYLALAWAAWRRTHGWVRLLALLGNLATPYLLYVQAFELDAWCPFCLLSTVLLAAVLVASLRRRGRVAWSPAPVLLVVVPVVLVVGLEQAISARDARRARTPESRTGSVTLAGRTYPLAEIDREIDQELTRLSWDKHRARLAWVDRKLLEKEAEAEGLSVDALRRREVERKLVLRPDERPKDPRALARVALKKQRAIEAALLQSLRKKYALLVDLPAPGVEEILFNPRQGPERGPQDAPLQIVVFSDFSCAACARLHDWLKDLPQQLGVEVRVAFRHNPLRPGKHAAAGAAAHAQGRFWEFADVLFANRTRLADLEPHAKTAGLDVAAFRAEIESARAQQAVDADIAEAQRLGVTGAPAVFVNGVYYAGVPDLAFVEAVLHARD